MSTTQDKAHILWRGRRIALIRHGHDLKVAFPPLSLNRTLIAFNLVIVGTFIASWLMTDNWIVPVVIMGAGLALLATAWLAQLQKTKRTPFISIDEQQELWHIPSIEMSFPRDRILHVEYQYGWRKGFLREDQPERWATASPNLSGHTMVRLALITKDDDGISRQWPIVMCQPLDCPTDGEAWMNLIELGNRISQETGVEMVREEDIEIPESLRRPMPTPEPERLDQDESTTEEPA